MSKQQEHYHFVTGRLAEHAVRRTVEHVAEKVGFAYSIQVLPITVAALMTSRWLLRHLEVPDSATQLFVPGYLAKELDALREAVGIDVQVGPRDIRDLPRFFGQARERENYGEFSIEVLAEINHADRLSIQTLLQTAQQLRESGADIIDLGCSPGNYWREVGDAVRELTQAGLRVSIDSFDRNEVSKACEAGAELVLSVNSTNWEAAVDWGAEVVVVPDDPKTAMNEDSTYPQTIENLASQSVPMRLDPILEPIGCGFAESLGRYIDCRKRYPDAEMMMGIGNITELTDADSAGLNVLLLGVCQELQIQSVLTTQVINWARSSVKECDLARRLVHYACKQGVPPKHLEPELVMLRDPQVNEFDVESIEALGTSIKDRNVRIMNAKGQIHAVSRETHAQSDDPFEVMQQLLESPIGESIDPSHAFYLGFEMAKALTANTLGKRYVQDEALDWGFLTRPEDHHRLARSTRPPAQES